MNYNSNLIQIEERLKKAKDFNELDKIISELENPYERILTSSIDQMNSYLRNIGINTVYVTYKDIKSVEDIVKRIAESVFPLESLKKAKAEYIIVLNPKKLKYVINKIRENNISTAANLFHISGEQNPFSLSKYIISGYISSELYGDEYQSMVFYSRKENKYYVAIFIPTRNEIPSISILNKLERKEKVNKDERLLYYSFLLSSSSSLNHELTHVINFFTGLRDKTYEVVSKEVPNGSLEDKISLFTFIDEMISELRGNVKAYLDTEKRVKGEDYTDYRSIWEGFLSNLIDIYGRRLNNLMKNHEDKISIARMAGYLMGTLLTEEAFSTDNPLNYVHEIQNAIINRRKDDTSWGYIHKVLKFLEI